MQKHLKKILFVLPFIIGMIGITTASYFFWQYRQAQKLLNSPGVIAQKESQDLIVSIGKLMELPTNEQPTVATVSDADKLKSSSFFQNAKNGDKVLIYPTAKKAILYDPTINKIIDVAPVNIGNTPTASSAPSGKPGTAASPAPTTITLALYNGTLQTGATSSVERKIADNFANVSFTTRTKASKTDYHGILVIDLNGNEQDMAAQIASTLHGQVSKLPDGETKPVGSDILVIVGAK